MSRLRDTIRRLVDLLATLRAKRTHPAVYALAVALFVGLGFIALSQFPTDSVEDPQVWPIVVLLVIAVPMNVVVNSLEYRLQARIVDVDVPPLQAIRVSILATASNMLPIPGSILVRTGSLIEHAGVKRASATSAAVGLVWLGVTLVPAAIAIGFVTGPAAGVLLGLLGIGVLGAGVASVRRLSPGWPFVVSRLLIVEAATVVIAGGRFWLVLRAIGFEAELEQLIPLTLAGALASASGFLPAGIGVRESAAAGIAALVDIPPAIGYIAAAGDTVATLIVIGVLASAVIMISRRDRSQTMAH